MRAVNLIPEEDRRGAGGAAGRSGGAAYVVLGGLALLVALVAVFALLGREADTARADAARLTARASQAEAQATALQGYAGFRAIRDKRVATVTSLAASRFDWAHALRELARVVPADVTLKTLSATIAPGVGGGGTGGGGVSLRGAIDSPAIELAGCSASQDDVAGMMSAMRRIDGVTRVSLESSQEADGSADAASSGDDAAEGDGGCAGGAEAPAFAMVVFLAAPNGASATGPAAAATTTP